MVDRTRTQLGLRVAFYRADVLTDTEVARTEEDARDAALAIIGRLNSCNPATGSKSPKCSLLCPKYEPAWTGTALWTKAVECLVLERLSSNTMRLHLHESLAGAFGALYLDSAHLRRQHLTSLASFKQTCEAAGSPRDVDRPKER
jgi:hypothetical protein